jgi:hypothetical protein
MRSTVLAILMAGAATACSSSSSSGGATANADAGEDAGLIIGCQGNLTVQSYSPGMGQMGTSSIFRFELVSATPEPVTTGTEVWTLKILDASGAPVTDATFPSTPTTPNPRPWMPYHGHGTSEVTVTNNKDGTYTFNPMYLFMEGLWETDIVAESGGKTDATKFFFCLD